MFSRLSFRAKIFVSQLILFIILIIMPLPFMERIVFEIVRKSLVGEAQELIDMIRSASSEQSMIEKMGQEKEFIFFRVSLFNDKGIRIYDNRFGSFPELPPINPPAPEVHEALQKGFGYSERLSKSFGIRFAYIAVAFTAHGNQYVIRTAYPYAPIEEMMHNFVLGFLFLGTLLLLFFMLMTWLIFTRFSQPIEKIVLAVKAYQEGKTKELPHIVLDKKVGENDEIRHLAETLNSLSERVEMQMQGMLEERDEKEAILESLGEGVMAVDASMKIQYINFIGSKMLGIPRRQLQGQLLGEVIHRTKRPLLERCLQLLQMCQEKSEIISDALSMGDGRKAHLNLIAAPKANRKGAIIVLQDDTDHYRILEMGKDFVANASHELRTPITIIRGFAETLQDLPEITPEMLHDIVEKIVRSCQRMDNLVRNLLTLADIENLPLSNLRSCNLITLVEECRERLLALHPEVELDVELNYEEIPLVVVPDLIELAISNLLENAVKYSKPPAKIRIEVHQEEDEVKIVIADKGMGIPAADIDHIFERFYTVNKAHSRKLGGAGLGLSIVKTVIDKHDGSIKVESILGEGTRFIITLPLHQPLSR